jgi:Haem-binding domain
MSRRGLLYRAKDTKLDHHRAHFPRIDFKGHLTDSPGFRRRECFHPQGGGSAAHRARESRGAIPQLPKKQRVNLPDRMVACLQEGGGTHKFLISWRDREQTMEDRRCLFVAFAGAQLVRPGRANPPTDAGLTIQAQAGTASGLVAVLDRSCGACHSNETLWPWYTQIAPVSWLMALGVREGRKAVKFSEWGVYPPERQRQLLVESCRDAQTGKMPGPWTLLHPEARLSFVGR